MRTRDPKSKLHETVVTTADMAEAARKLHERLTWVVKQLDAGRVAGVEDAKTLEQLRFSDEEPTRWGMPSGPVVTAALRLVAERKVVDLRRRSVGFSLMMIAFRASGGELSPDEVVRATKAERGDSGATVTNIRDALRLRSRSSRFAKVYYAIAFDADVWPRPDSRSALRGQLKDFYVHHLKRDRKSKA